VKARWLVAAVVAPGVLLVAILVPLMFVAVQASQLIPTLPQASASQAAASEIPPIALNAYQAAAPLCPGLSWATLAGIGKLETGHGTANGHHLDDSGQTVPSSPPLHSNINNGASGYAYGPMQFLAGTWAAYGPRVAPGLNQTDMASGPIQNVGYAAKAAALLLCSAAGGQIGDDATLHKAIDSYSGSTDGYFDDVTSMAALYAITPTAVATAVTSSPATGSSGLRIVLAAVKFVGVPYANGNPAKGDPPLTFSGHPGDAWVTQHFAAQDDRYATLDCSGLVNATMYLAFRLQLDYCSDGYRTDPRFTHVPMGALQAGDLVLYGHCGLGVPGHIAIVAMFDPLTGLASTIDAARHGTVVGFRAAQQVGSWTFTDAVRYTG
jgi:cell wall-associated NlpC family hydrolase